MTLLLHEQISLVEIPGVLFAAFTIDHLGRKTCYVSCIMLTGIGCLSAAYIEDGEISKTIVCLIGLKHKFNMFERQQNNYIYPGNR